MGDRHGHHPAEANAAAVAARATGADRLPDATLKHIRNHHGGAIAKGNTDNRAKPGALAAEARKLLRRFTRYEDMILRFATDLSVPFTNNVSERAVRPVKVQQRTSGGAWRTLEGLTNFATVQSYLDTTTKWGIDNTTPSSNSSPPARGYHQPLPPAE